MSGYSRYSRYLYLRIAARFREQAVFFVDNGNSRPLYPCVLYMFLRKRIHDVSDHRGLLKKRSSLTRSATRQLHLYVRVRPRTVELFVNTNLTMK